MKLIFTYNFLIGLLYSFLDYCKGFSVDFISAFLSSLSVLKVHVLKFFLTHFLQKFLTYSSCVFNMSVF